MAGRKSRRGARWRPIMLLLEQMEERKKKQTGSEVSCGFPGSLLFQLFLIFLFRVRVEVKEKRREEE